MSVSVKFAVLNPLDGSYMLYSSKDDAVNKIIDQAIEMYEQHVHYKMYTTVQINEDGSQTWGFPDDDYDITKEEVVNRIKNKLVVMIN